MINDSDIAVGILISRYYNIESIEIVNNLLHFHHRRVFLDEHHHSFEYNTTKRV